MCDVTFSRHIISLDDFGDVNIFDGNVHSGEQFSFSINLASYYSEKMDVLQFINVIMNVVLPSIVFWNMIASVVVMSRIGESAQIYRDEILHHTSTINVIDGIFQNDNARPQTAGVCRYFLQQNNVHVLP